jgi:hypothetical protein
VVTGKGLGRMGEVRLVLGSEVAGENARRSVCSLATPAVLNRVHRLEQGLFDSEGHVRRDVGTDTASALLGQINVLRLGLGWLALDLQHHLVWPEELELERFDSPGNG